MNRNEAAMDGIAIVGMAGRFPGAPSVERLWDVLREGRETIRRLSDEELAREEYDFEAVKDSSNYVRLRGTLDDVDMFDAGFFGMTPREAAILDPQQRLWLECAWEALERAGYAPEKYAGTVGVFGGSYINTYLLSNLCVDREYIERLVRFRAVDAFQTLISNDKDYLPSRTAYKFNLRGPAVTVQTACSTSLVAVAQACQSLLQYESDLCLAGGVCISFPQAKGYMYQEGGMVSPDGHCRAFDAKAQGTVFSNGIGVVALKRLEDALRDGDHIHAVIRGAALNNDGATKLSYSAPSVDGQAEVIALAHALAGVDPETIEYVEAHGTGTPLGDPIEVKGLTKAFRAKTEKTQFCGIGSIKTNLGHLDSAAGVAGLFKAVLALEHELIPANLHYEAPNPEIDFATSPFYVVSEPKPWPRGTRPRRAGVSSFGVGGTNAHVVLEESPVPAPSSKGRPAHLLLLSAKTPGALEQATSKLRDHLSSAPHVSMADIAYTLQVGRQDFTHRRVAVVRDAADAVQVLSGGDRQRLVSQEAGGADRSLVFMFPGQGAQHVNMGRALYEQEPTFREHIDLGAKELRPILNLDIRELLYPAPADETTAAEKLKQTEVTQPVLFVVQFALAKLWEEWGIVPDCMIGHSVGEYVAACLGGVFSFEDAIRVLAARARLMQQQPAGSMLAVRVPEEDLRERIVEPLALAAVNAPMLSVVSGPPDAIGALQQTLEAEGVKTTPLHTSHAYHSSMMEPALQPFADIVSSIELRVPQRPFISSLTGTWITAQQAQDPQYWAQQLRRPVRFSAGVQELQQTPGRVFLEVGPGTTLSTFVAQHPEGNSRRTVVASLGHAQDQRSALELVLGAVGRLWMAAVPVEWARLYSREQRRRVLLPTYPFERKRHWVDAPVRSTSSRGEQQVIMSSTQSAPMPAPAPGPSVQDVGVARRTAIFNRACDVLGELSGMELSAADGNKSFMEMGFDSLFLTQASAELEGRFGVKVKFRQLLEDISSLNALTDYLAEQLPADAFVPQREPVAAPVAAIEHGSPAAAAAAPSPGMTPAPVAPSAGGSVERLIQEQLAVMQQQLAVLRGGPAPVSVSTAAGPVAMPPATRPAGDGTGPFDPNRPAVQASAAKSAKESGPAKRFGPYKAIERSRDGGLTAAQQEHLDALVKRFNARTAKSKAYQQEHHHGVADPRTVAGYRQVWKELVYQVVTDRSDGARIWDIDGNEYIDLTMCFGANLLGHRPPFVVDAVRQQLERGFEIGPQSALTGEVAKLLREFTGMERVSFCNTGSEAVMAAMRMARTVTGRSRIVYFSGDYHGTIDEVLGRAHTRNGALMTLPAAPGIPQSALNNVMVLDYGSPESLEILEGCANEIAAVVVEPVQSRHPELQPKEFVHALRDLADKAGFALIFDEVITGFRVHPRGAAAWYGVRPDIASYGKIIGGGLPIGVVAGRAKYMDTLDGGPWQFGDDSVPEADVTFFAGTFVRHPLALAAARAVLKHLKEQGPALQERLASRVTAFATELNGFFERRGVPIRIRHFSSWFRFDFPNDLTYVNLLFYHLVARGIYIREAGQNCFISTAHTDEDLQTAITAIKTSVIELQDAGFLPPAPEGAGDESGTSLMKGRRFPLSAAQREVWLAVQLGDDVSCAYNTGFSATLKGTCEVAHLVRAVKEVLDRHEALHVRFSGDGDYQEVVDDADIDIPILDLTALSEDQRARECVELLRAETGTPFDLTRGPLVRVKVVQLRPDEVLLVYTAHHIVCDGWSSAVMIEEMSQVYSALCRDEMWVLEPAYPYHAYVGDEQREEADGLVRESLEYWAKRFETLPAPLALPTDRSRPPVKSYRGGTLKWTFAEDAYQTIRRSASAEGATLFAMLLAAFKLFLHRMSGQDDIVVAVPSAGQNRVGQNALIGHCVNLLPLRTEVDGSWTFRDFLKAVKRELLDAYEHQCATFGQIVQEVHAERDPARLPLVEVMFNLDRDSGVLGFHGLESEVRETPKQAVNFDLFFNLNEADGRLTMDLDYNTDLFDETTMRRWLGHFETLLRSIGAKADGRIGTLAMLSSEERREYLVDWNATDAPIAESTLHGLFEQQAAKANDRAAVRGVDVALSYRELDRRANQLAHHLIRQGVGIGDRVGVAVDRTASMMVALLGVLKSGAAYVPLDPDFPAERLRFMSEDAELAALVTVDRLGTMDVDLDGPTVRLDGDHDLIASEPDSPVPVNMDTSSPAYVIYTSGSTGRPKGVVVTHRNVVNFLSSMAQQPGMREQDVLVAVTTLSFDISALELFLPLIVGAEVVIADRDTVVDGPALGALLESSGATMMQATPSLWRMLFDTGWKGSNRLTALCGGEPLPADLAGQLSGCVAGLWNMYGPTETTIWSTCQKVESAQPPISIGRPIANTQVYVLDENREPVPVGVTGELLIGGAGVTEGYWKRPDLTSERFVPNSLGVNGGQRLYRTGDLARFDSDGRLECLGRLDNQVKVRGYRIELGEVESVLAQHPTVRQAVATVWRPRTGDSRLVGYVVPSNGQVASSADLREFVRERLPEYMVPQHVVTLDAVPLTANGKVDRKRLPPPAEDVAVEALTAPTTEAEVSVADVWKAVVGVERLGTDSNFFDIGGHSILATQAVARLREAFKVPLSLRHLFEAPTVGGLARQIEALQQVVMSAVPSGSEDADREEMVF